MPKVLGIKRSIIDQKEGVDECTLNFVCNLFANQNAYEKNKSLFSSSHEEWNQNWVLAIEFAILGHVVFPRNLEGVILDCYNSGSELNKVILSSQRS